MPYSRSIDRRASGPTRVRDCLGDVDRPMTATESSQLCLVGLGQSWGGSPAPEAGRSPARRAEVGLGHLGVGRGLPSFDRSRSAATSAAGSAACRRPGRRSRAPAAGQTRAAEVGVEPVSRRSSSPSRPRRTPRHEPQGRASYGRCNDEVAVRAKRDTDGTCKYSPTGGQARADGRAVCVVVRRHRGPLRCFGATAAQAQSSAPDSLSPPVAGWQRGASSGSWRAA